MSYQTLGEMVAARIEKSPGSAALRVRRDGRYQDVSWRSLSERMERIAAGLLTAMELADHAPIAILGNTSEDWIACDFAALTVGLRTIPIYATLLANEVGYQHVDIEVVMTIVDNRDQLEKVREFRDGFTFFEKEYGADQIKLQHIVVIDPTGIEPADDWESLADLEKRGAAKLEETRKERERRAAAIKRDDVATYTYTSGTTGPPKAAIQTHGNHLAMLESASQTPMFDPERVGAGLFLFLPLAHSFGRLIQFAGAFGGFPLIISSVPTLLEDLQESRPGFFPSAPRVFEKMKSKIETAVAGAPPLRQKLFHWAMDAGRATIPYRSRGEPLPLLVSLEYAIADKIVLSKLRARLGLDRAGFVLSGSAPLDSTVHEFFLACGVDLFEAYGLTETCPGLTGNLPGAFRVGTVGRPLPGIEIKIADDGEILAKGPNVVSGYHGREDANAEAFDDEGWFHTGDLGAQDSDGFVKITGRKKELMKTSAGKYIAPAKIEGRLKLLPMIQEAVVIADGYNYATALIAIDDEELSAWAKQTGNPSDRDSDAVNAAVQAHVDEVNKGLASFETIKYFRIIPPLTVDDGLLTASLKVKRKPVSDRYADRIAEMYAKK